MRRVLLLVLTVAQLGSGADLKAKIDQIISSSPSLSKAFVGLKVVNLHGGEVLCELNSGRLFIPASNMKLFTAALALERLGPDHRFVTRITADQPIDPEGALPGDLVFLGGGDPSMSGRAYPYEYRAAAHPGADYSFRAVEELADQLVARGLKRIDGDVVGDDSRYVWEAHPDAWAFGDATWEYGAPVSALILNDNSFALTLRPAARPGDLAQLWQAPPFEYFSIDNRVRTTAGGERKLQFERRSEGRELHVSGTLPARDPGVSQLLAVDDPAVYAASVLGMALQRRGVAVRGQSVAKHRFTRDGESTTAPTEDRLALAERSSPPLSQILEVTDKVSQNLHAEVLLREVGLAARHEGSREAGLAEMEEFLLNQAGISKDSYVFTDGSGLSRSTLVTPAAILALLAHMYNSPHRELWMSLLPVAGADGTLAARFPEHPEARAIHAKTGTLAHVRAISGYVTQADRDPLAFSLVVNNANTPASELSEILDRILLALLN